MNVHTTKINGFTITVTDATPEILQALEKALKRGISAVGELAEGHAKEVILENERVDTGEMLNSVGHAEDGNATYVGCNVDHGIYNELGTVKMTGIHFLQSAAADHPKEYRDTIKDSMQNA